MQFIEFITIEDKIKRANDYIRIYDIGIAVSHVRSLYLRNDPMLSQLKYAWPRIWQTLNEHCPDILEDILNSKNDDDRVRKEKSDRMKKFLHPIKYLYDDLCDITNYRISRCILNASNWKYGLIVQMDLAVFKEVISHSDCQRVRENNSKTRREWKSAMLLKLDIPQELRKNIIIHNEDRATDKDETFLHERIFIMGFNDPKEAMGFKLEHS